MIGYNLITVSVMISIFALTDRFNEFLVAANSYDQRSKSRLNASFIRFR